MFARTRSAPAGRRRHERKHAAAVVIVVAIALAIAIVGSGADSAFAATTIRLTNGLSLPVFVGAPAGDAHRVFVLEQNGAIRIVKEGVLLPTPFLDLNPLIPNVSGNDERGLLGLAFAPDYATSGRFYVYYIDLSSDTVVARYLRSGTDPDLADPTSGQLILPVDQPYSNHNGGMIAFGPDGYLYVGLGDGGSQGDPQDRGQDLTVLLGKILRLDVSGAGPGYVVPPDNPFVGAGGGARPEIWAVGLRNPYRFGFDRQTGDLWIGDVGQDDWEEIDFEAAGGGGGFNYGWSIMEATHCFKPTSGCSQSGLTLPVHEYPHGEGCSVTGGYVYRGVGVPELRGQYLFADFCSGTIWSLERVGGQVGNLQDRTAELAPAAGGQQLASISSFGEDGVGELYIVARSAGEVYKIMPAGATGIPPLRSGLRLEQNHPNPFNPRTALSFSLAQGGAATLAVYRLDGRRVRTLVDAVLPPGPHEVNWDGKDEAGRSLASGPYIGRLESDGAVASCRMLLLR